MRQKTRRSAREPIGQCHADGDGQAVAERAGAMSTPGILRMMCAEGAPDG
jgi:hypothetical protein